MSLDGVGFGEGEERFPSMISLKLLFPTFLASWGRKKKKSTPCISAALGIKSCSLLRFSNSLIISNISLEMKIVKGVDCCLKKSYLFICFCLDECRHSVYPNAVIIEVCSYCTMFTLKEYTLFY